MGACNMLCNFRSSYEEKIYDLPSFKNYIPTAKEVILLRELTESGRRAVTFCGSGECAIHPGKTAGPDSR